MFNLSCHVKCVSLLTEGRLNDGITPSCCNVASIVAPFIGLPLSEHNVTCSGLTRSRRHISNIKSAASALNSSL